MKNVKYPLIALQFKGPLRTRGIQGWYFTDGSTPTSVGASKPPNYPTHVYPRFNAKL